MLAQGRPWQPTYVSHRAWKRLVAGVLVGVIPILSLIAVLYLRDSLIDPRLVALIAATIGTTWRTWGDVLRVGERLANSPADREAILHDLGVGFWAWGLVCAAAWIGLFSNILT